MFERFFSFIKEFIKEEYKFLIILLFTYILFMYPVNYYIIVGGGISDVGSRIDVADAYKSKGSFNISYVTELDGKLITYLLSYIIPSWDRVSVDNYKYDSSESLEDIAFRGDLDLSSANGNAIKHAYQLANREYVELSTEIYVVATFEEYDTKLKIQDQLLSINGKSFDTISSYQEYLQTLDHDSSALVKVMRKGKEKEISCKIYENNGKKILGVSLQVVHKYKTDPKVDIKFKKDESGPSGGLITTLDIYNKLTKKDLTSSLKIAGTGTIEEDGRIGTIGGVEYKLIGAEAGGADVFLVPSGENYEECKKVKKEKKLAIKLISVDTFADAVSKLEKLKN